jgi:malonate-semialdehyde dehydrogenase (acetylating) / methylmalonate-semialdehyde dehydrogenase
VYSRGPVISPVAKNRILGLIASAEEEGGSITLDGRGIQVPKYPDGNFIAPTIIEANTSMRCYRSVFFRVWSQLITDYKMSLGKKSLDQF